VLAAVNEGVPELSKEMDRLAIRHIDPRSFLVGKILHFEGGGLQASYDLICRGRGTPVDLSTNPPA
jgi:hypothetical protein